MYGTTETTIHTSYKEITTANTAISEIGKTLPDKKIFVLDKQLNPSPIGAVGELYIGGTGLTRGYLNQTDLTKHTHDI